jgi:hypothetical protein
MVSLTKMSSENQANGRHLSANYKSGIRNRWTVGGMYAELQLVLIVKCFAPNNFTTCLWKNCFND